MPSLEREQRILDIIRTMLTLEDMTRDLRKAIRQPVHGGPEELAGRCGLNAVYALKATVSNVDILALSTPSLAILLGKAAYDELLHHVKKIVGQQVGVGSINEGLTNIRSLRCGRSRYFHSLLCQKVDCGLVRDIVGTTTLGRLLARGHLAPGLGGGR